MHLSCVLNYSHTVANTDYIFPGHTVTRADTHADELEKNNNKKQ